MKSISERMLRKWRKEALHYIYAGLDIESQKGVYSPELYTLKSDMCKKILQLTQELLDQHLLRKK